ncbi:MAG: endoglucanase-like protein, partial [Paucimonas sp.]|nr:endoglucanase-like protein [Paucimonas sp.]
MLRILHNHLGYFTHGAKRALVQSNTPLKADKFSIYDANTREPVFHGELSTQGPVARWRDWKFWEADFSALKVPGKYFLAI